MASKAKAEAKLASEDESDDEKIELVAQNDAQWYEQHAVTSSSKEEVVRIGFGLTKAKYGSLKGKANEKANLLIQPGETLRGNTTTRTTIAKRTMKELHLKKPKGIPEEWFEQAVVWIAQRARNVTARKQATPWPSGFNQPVHEDGQTANPSESQTRKRKRKRDGASSDDNMDHTRNPGRRAKSNRSKDNQMAATTALPSIASSPAHEPSGFAYNPTPTPHASAYNPTPTPHASAYNPTPTPHGFASSYVPTSPPIMVSIADSGSNECVEYADIVDNNQQVSLDRFKATLLEYDADYGQLRYSGKWNGNVLSIRTSLHLRRVIDSATRNNEDYVHIVATLGATMPREDLHGRAADKPSANAPATAGYVPSLIVKRHSQSPPVVPNHGQPLLTGEGRLSSRISTPMHHGSLSLRLSQTPVRQSLRLSQTPVRQSIETGTQLPQATPPKDITYQSNSLDASAEKNHASPMQTLDKAGSRDPYEEDGQHRVADDVRANLERADSEHADSEHADLEHADSEYADSEHADSEYADSDRWTESDVSEYHGRPSVSRDKEEDTPTPAQEEDDEDNVNLGLVHTSVQPQKSHSMPKEAAVPPADNQIVPYQGEQTDADRFDNNTVLTMPAAVDDDGLSDEDVADNEDAQERMYKEFQDLVNATLKGRLARMTYESLQNTSRLFGIPEKQLRSSTSMIPIDSRWLLKQDAALFLHQWLLVAEMVMQEATYGGGTAGDDPGAGKTVPALFKAYVNFFILRLRFQIYVDQGLRRENRHLIMPASQQKPDDKCPSQPNLPIPCPCKVGTWTSTHPVPNGVALHLALPTTMDATVRTMRKLFDGAAILNDPEFPLRIAIAHEQTRRNCSDYLSNDLTRAELGLMCRVPVWEAGLVPSRASNIRQPAFPLHIPRPVDAFPDSASLQAGRFLIISTLPSVQSQLFQKTTVETTWTLRRQPKKSERPNQGLKTVGEHFSSGPRNMLVVREMLVDEGHNNYSFENKTMTLLRNYRLDLYDATNIRMRYWMMSGTARYSGIPVVACHIGAMLSRSSWSPEDPDDENGFLDPGKKVWLGRLCCQPPSNANTAITKPQAPVQRLVAEWKELLRTAQVLAEREDDTSSTAFDREANAAFEMALAKHVEVCAPIYEAFVIERSHDTKRLDGSALMATADIKTHSRILSIPYGEDEAAYLVELAERVKRSLADDLEQRLQAWEVHGCKGPMPVKAKSKMMQGYHDYLLAGTSPGLVRWFKESGHKYGLETLTAKDPCFAEWWLAPLKCPFYTEFDTIIQGDRKWLALQKIVDTVRKEPKSAYSNGKPSKLLIATNKPTTALLYFCGMLRKLNQRSVASKGLTDIRNQSVTAIYSGMPLSNRPNHYDAINDPDSNTQFFVASVWIVAEGLPITGANYAVLVDVVPELNKVIQFFSRPCRHPQTEKDIYTTQLWNAQSAYEQRVIARQEFNRDVEANVAKFGDATAVNKEEATDSDSDEVAFAGQPQGKVYKDAYI